MSRVVLRRRVHHFVGAEVVQDFVRQPSEGMRTQAMTRGEALAGASSDMES